MSVYSKNKYLRKIQKKYFRPHFERHYISSFFKDAHIGDSNGKKVCIYAAIPYQYNTPFEILLYKSLVSEGYDTRYCIYDKSISIYELTTSKFDANQRRAFIDSHFALGQNLLDAAKVDYERIAALPIEFSKQIDQLDSLDSVLTFEYDFFKMGDIVKRVLYRYFRSLKISNNPAAVDVAKEFLKTVLTNYFYTKEIITKSKPDIMMFSHGIYCSWEIVSRLCERYGVDYVCYDRAKTLSSMNFNWNQESPDWSFEKAWIKYQDKQLDDYQNQKVDQYLKDRELQSSDVYAYNFKPKAEDLLALKNKLNIPANAKVITFFTNLIWDAANEGREEIFNSFSEAIIDTVEHFNSRDDIHFVVRPHPAEQVLGTKQKYTHLLTDIENKITVIDESLQVNSFSVLDLTDIAITHTSTIGLEMAITGKPSIVLGKTHYRGLGFTIDPVSKVEYFDAIQKAIFEGQYDQRQEKLARKYFYMMMFLYQKITSLTFEGNSFLSYNYPSLNNLIETDEVFKEIMAELNAKERSSFVKWR